MGVSNDIETSENVENICESNNDLANNSTENGNVLKDKTDRLVTSDEKSDATNEGNEQEKSKTSELVSNDTETSENVENICESNNDLANNSTENGNIFNHALDILSKDAPPTKTIMKRKLEYKNIHKTEYVRIDMLFKSLSGFKRDGHPDYQVIDEELQKDYNEKFMAQGAVAQSICAEQQNEKVCDDEDDG